MSGNFQYDCQVSIYCDQDEDNDGGCDDNYGDEHNFSVDVIFEIFPHQVESK